MGSSSSLRKSAIASLLGITQSTSVGSRSITYPEDVRTHRAFAAPLGTLPGYLSDFEIVKRILYCSLIRAAKRITATALGEPGGAERAWLIENGLWWG